jgi:solute carrier family 9 (sodium/hydrogen exchanger), member 8
MTEISLMILCPLVAYFVASGLYFSGIVSILINGVFLNIYAKPNISTATRKIIKMLYEVVAHTAETIVFLFLGIGLFTIPDPFKTMGFGTFITMVLNLNLARILNIAIVSFLVNLQRSENSKINLKTQFVMWFSGLRGAMAYALALQASSQLSVGPVILIMTLVYSLITILGFGTCLYPVLQLMDVKNKPRPLGEVELDTDNFSNRVKAAL